MWGHGAFGLALEDQGRESERVESLASSLAHDLANSSLATLEAIAQAAAETPSRRLDLARAAAFRTVTTARHLASLSPDSILSPPVESLDLRQLADSNRSLLKSVLPPQVALLVEFNEALPLVRGRTIDALCCLLSAINNAGQAVAARPGCPTFVSLHAGISQSERASESQTTWIEVRDRAGGIAPELLPRVTEPFVTSRPDRRRGLGLYFCRRVCEQWSGALTVLSEGTETRVRFSFPASSSAG